MDDHRHHHDQDNNKNGGGDDYPTSRSFDHHKLKHHKKKNDDKKWLCVSPMTQHVVRNSDVTPDGGSIRSSTTPVILHRSRSRSFNDYIDKKNTFQQHNLYLPIMLAPDGDNESKGTATASSSKEFGISPAPSNASDGGSSRSNSSVGSEDDLNKDENPLYISIMYGLINATIVVPVVMSFGNIIYSNDAFSAYTPTLIKLTMISGVVHQICFCLFSSLPFVVGSVQDAGLIFLSSMATDIVVYCQSRGYDDETLLATVTIGLGVSTATLGVGLIIIGKLRLAGYVQMLPTCVIAGYLAFIGWFCGKSGIALMAGASELTFPILFENIKYVIPGIIGAIFIYGSVRVFRHVAVLPSCIIVLLVLFYSGLVAFNSSIDQARDNGWIRKSEQAPIWYHTWDYLKFDKVVWGALPQLILTEISMIFVVALSSSLDVAAIELEMKQPLNYNGELTMIGVSNVISGLTGGYTGSYIFSQSIFTLRSGIRSRMAGFALAICQAVIIVTPFPILSYVPNFFYGSLLGMICIDLVYEWLWDFRYKSKTAEYLIGLFTFGMIQILGVEYGILVGIAVYVICRQFGIDVGELKLVTDENEIEKAESLRLTAQEATDEEQMPLVPTRASVTTTGPQYDSTSLIPPKTMNKNGSNGSDTSSPELAI